MTGVKAERTECAGTMPQYVTGIFTHPGEYVLRAEKAKARVICLSFALSSSSDMFNVAAQDVAGHLPKAFTCTYHMNSTFQQERLPFHLPS